VSRIDFCRTLQPQKHHDAALARAAHDLARTREQTLLCAALKARQDPAAILR